MAEKETGLPLRLAFAGLWGAADREGRFKWQPERLKIDILPYDDVDFSRVLDALVTRGFLVKYTSQTCALGVIPSFKSHQIVNNRESASILPPPPKNMEKLKDSNNLTRESRVNDACVTALNLDRVEQEQEQELNNTPYSPPEQGDLAEEKIEKRKRKRKASPAVSDETMQQANEVFDYWREKRNHQGCSLDQKRLQAIVARFSEKYTVQRIKDAIDGIEHSPHHMGKNDRNTVYDDIELICRSGLNVDKFAELKRKNTKIVELEPVCGLEYDSPFQVKTEFQMQA